MLKLARKVWKKELSKNIDIYIYVDLNFELKTFFDSNTNLNTLAKFKAILI